MPQPKETWKNEATGKLVVIVAVSKLPCTSARAIVFRPTGSKRQQILFSPDFLRAYSKT